MNRYKWPSFQKPDFFTLKKGDKVFFIDPTMLGARAVLENDRYPATVHEVIGDVVHVIGWNETAEKVAPHWYDYHIKDFIRDVNE